MKTLNQRIHAKRREAERYGLEINREEYKVLNELARMSPVLKRESNRITIREFVYIDKKLRVVYDSHRHQIVTFLPLSSTPSQT